MAVTPTAKSSETPRQRATRRVTSDRSLGRLTRRAVFRPRYFKDTISHAMIGRQGRGLDGVATRSTSRQYGPTREPGTAGVEAQAREFAPKSTSPVFTVPAVRPGAVWYFQYRFVWAMTLSGGGAPNAERSSVVWASPTSVAS